MKNLNKIISVLAFFVVMVVALATSYAQNISASSVNFGGTNILKETSGFGPPSPLTCTGVQQYTQTGATSTPFWVCHNGTFVNIGGSVTLAQVLALFHTVTVVPNVLLNTVFNEGAAGTTLQGTAPAVGPAGQVWQFPTPGSVWNFQAGGGVIAPNALDGISGGPFIDVGASDYVLKVSVSSFSGGVGLIMMRYTDANNMVIGFLNGTSGNVIIFNFVAGATNQLGTGTLDYGQLTFTVSGSTITATGAPGQTPIVATLPDSHNLTGTKVGFTSQNGTNMAIRSLNVTAGTRNIISTCSGALNGDGNCYTVVPNVLAMLSGSTTKNALSVAEIQTSDNGDGTGVLSCQEDHKRGIYDPRCIQYAGGLAAAITPAQQQAVLQATLDQAACDNHDGKIGSGVVLYPAGYTSSISFLRVHSNITLKCAGSEGMLFGGGCGLTDSYVNQVTPPGTVTATPSTTGGTLAAGTYFYRVASIAPVLGQSLGSAEVSAVTTGTTGSVSLSWAPVSGATSYQIYRGTAAGVESVFYTSATASYIDTNGASTAGSPGQNIGLPMIVLDGTNHGMCHGVDTHFGGASAAVIGFNFAGQDGLGGAEEGIRAFDIHNYVAHNSFNAFGGPAIEMSGVPGDGVAEWNFITNSPRYWIVNPAAIPTSGGIGIAGGNTGALLCVGLDTTCNNNEVSTGSSSVHSGARQANYPRVAAILVDGGSARMFNNFVQASDVGMLLNCCSGGNQITGLRSDLTAGGGLLAEGGGSTFTSITINNPCTDPAWVDPTSHISTCYAIDTGSGNTFAGVFVEPFGGFGASFVGAAFSMATTGTVSGFTNGYTLDAFGNGADYFNSARGSFPGLGAPAGAQQTTNSCTLTGSQVVATNGCTHILFNDTTPVSISELAGLGDGKTITIEGTSNDTLLSGIHGFANAVIETCSGAPVVLGNGPLSFFYTTRDSTLHQLCDRNDGFVTYNWTGQTPPSNNNKFTVDVFGSYTARQIQQPSVVVTNAGLTPGSFTYCYVAAGTVFGEPSSSAPVCDNHTPPAGSGSGGNPFVQLVSTFPTGWESGEVELFSTTDPAFTPGLLASFAPSRQPGVGQTFTTIYTTTLITPTGSVVPGNLNGTGGFNDHRAVPAHNTEFCPDGDKADGVGPGGTGFGRYVCHPGNVWTFYPYGTAVSSF